MSLTGDSSDEALDENKDLAQTPIRNSVGKAIRTHRKERGLSARTLAERAGVSPSLISQIETEKLTPSVGSLVKIARELGISLDELFFEGDLKSSTANGAEAVRFRPADRHVGVLHADERAKISLATGCHYERLTPHSESNVDFTHIIFEPGGRSSDADLMRHQGREYGLVLSGTFKMKIGFDEYELGPGDSIVFNGEIPHRAWNPYDEPVEVAWVVVFAEGEAKAP